MKIQSRPPVDDTKPVYLDIQTVKNIMENCLCFEPRNVVLYIAMSALRTMYHIDKITDFDVYDAGHSLEITVQCGHEAPYHTFSHHF